MSANGVAFHARRLDVVALWGGVVACALATGLIWLLSPLLAAVPHLPDQGAAWYYWILPEPTFWSRATAWGLYAAHQATLWALIYYAQTRVRRYTTGLHPVNVVALAANGAFILLHVLQTHVWYDGLAQDVSIFSSQGSVVLLLVAVLLMENSRRGLFFGKRAPIGQDVVRVVRQYHGYVFAWAAVYTFWYHPAEATVGHLVGFFYMFLLLLQGSLFFTRIHTNRWWTVAQEVVVLAHGALVAWMQGNGLWPMFAFGFGGIFVITQLYGLGLSRAVRLLATAAYVLAVAAVYSARGWGKLNEVARIPVIEYLCVFLLAGLVWSGLALVRRVRGRPVQERSVLTTA